MAVSVNRVFIMGNLGKDPVVNYQQSGSPVVTLSVATTDTWEDKKTEEKKQHTEWHRVCIYGHPAEFAKNYLKKGHQVYVEGTIRKSKWKSKDGEDRAATQIIAQHVTLLSSIGSEQDIPSTSAPFDEDIPL